jgi:hypothetical protein
LSTAEERNQQFLKRLRKVAGRSFFAWVHYYDPHGDYSPPAPYDAMYPVGMDFDPVPGAEWMDLSDEKKSGTSSVDILPTVLDLLGFESPGEAIDGRNGNDWAVREDHLFRPFDDYGEENDLKLVEAERARRMESFLDTWLAEAKKGSLPSLRRDVLDQRTKEALETLGYIR